VAQRARFEANLRLGSLRRWQDFHARLNLSPAVWEIQAVAAEHTLRLRSDDGQERFERVFTFSELRNPERLLQGFLGPFALGVLRSLGWPAEGPDAARLEGALRWQAREVTAKIGHASVRAYRLESHLLDRYPIVILISRVGEILRVELPGELVLVNDQLANF
jgi:hypothetical protein